jgi:hypothetical protein
VSSSPNHRSFARELFDQPQTVRPKILPRLHAEPDPEVEGLSSEEADKHKLCRKQRMHRLIAELTSLRGTLSGRDLAELWLGDRQKEGTIRSWKNYRDLDRYPRSADLAKLEELVNAERERRFGGAFR